MNNFLTSTVGSNWRTSLTGLTSRLFMGFMMACVLQPKLVTDLLGVWPYKDKVVQAFLLLWFIIGTAKDFNTKDKQVAGNNPDKTSEGAVPSQTLP